MEQDEEMIWGGEGLRIVNTVKIYQRRVPRRLEESNNIQTSIQET